MGYLTSFAVITALPNLYLRIKSECMMSEEQLKELVLALYKTRNRFYLDSTIDKAEAEKITLELTHDIGTLEFVLGYSLFYKGMLGELNGSKKV
jgi:hypothetical protein